MDRDPNNDSSSMAKRGHKLWLGHYFRDLVGRTGTLNDDHQPLTIVYVLGTRILRDICKLPSVLNDHNKLNGHFFKCESNLELNSDSRQFNVKSG